MCPTTEYQPYVTIVNGTSQDIRITTDHIISASTTSSSFAVPPIMSLSTPPTMTTTTIIPTSVSLPSTIEKKFTVEYVSDGSEDESVEEPVESFATVTDIPCGQDERTDISTPAEIATLPVTSDDPGRTAGTTAGSSLRSDSSNSLYDDKVQRAPKTDCGKPTYQQGTASPMFPGYHGAEKPPEKFALENLHMLSESFSVLMYTLLQVLRNPAMESFVHDLEHKYGSGSGPLLPEYGSVPQEYNYDPEYQRLQTK